MLDTNTSKKQNTISYKALIIEGLLVILVLALFTGMAAKNIGFSPAPWKDEPWLMQPAYEAAQTGQMSLPMFRHFGNQVGERIFTDPAFTYLLAGWFKLFGLGIAQGRGFNLFCSIIALLMVYLLGRFWGGRVTGTIAVILLICDNNYFSNSRILRNDIPSVAFALMAAYLYTVGRGRTDQRALLYLFGAGIAAALSVLSHLNGIYIVGTLGLWLLIEYGWRIIIKPKPWLVAAGINLLLLPYAVYCWLNRELYSTQWQLFTPNRTRGVTSEGMWLNIVEEAKRYRSWEFGEMFMTTNWPVVFFKWLTILAIIYLVVMIIKNGWQHRSLLQPHSYILIALIWIVCFFATQVTNKTHSYLPHLTTWFALAGAFSLQSLGQQLISRIPRLANLLGLSLPVSDNRSSLLTKIGLILLLIGIGGYLATATILMLKYIKYSRTLSPAKYDYMVSAIKSQVGTELVPVGLPSYWHIFAQKDNYRAFSRRLSRRILKGDFAGEEYAIIADKRQKRKLLEIAEDVEQPIRQVHLLAEIPNSPYGQLWIYYVGSNPSYLNRPTTQFVAPD